jgi:hypothetical protein
VRVTISDATKRAVVIVLLDPASDRRPRFVDFAILAVHTIPLPFPLKARVEVAEGLLQCECVQDSLKKRRRTDYDQSAEYAGSRCLGIH